MCGIVGFAGKNNDAIESILDVLSRLEYRGYDSAGIAAFFNKKLKVIKTEGRISNLKDKIEITNYGESNCGIGHTRWATHGKPSNKNAHPHTNNDNTIALVHNGIIENYISLKQELIKKGYKFYSDTDTEILVKLLDFIKKNYNLNIKETILKLLKIIDGSYALGIIFNEYPEQIIAVKKGSPLIIGIGNNQNVIASDVIALLKYAKEYIILEDNEIAFVKKDSIRIINTDGKEIKKEIHKVNYDLIEVGKYGYPNFMIKEIFEQPKAILNTIKNKIKDNQINFTIPGISDMQLKKIKHIHIIACGSALNAGMIGKVIIENLTNVPCSIEVASEFRYQKTIIQENDLCIFISQSGETADTLAALYKAKKQKVLILSVVNVISSTLARESDGILYTLAGPEIAVATTKAYSSQLIILYLFAMHLSKIKKFNNSNEKYLCDSILQIPNKIKIILETLDLIIQQIAIKYANRSNIFFIGRGIDYPVAIESSLKLKEISYIHSEAYPAGELKHGTISLIEDGTLVIAIATQKDLFYKTISNVREVISRGATVILITKESINEDFSECEKIIKIPDIYNFFTPSLTIIITQLFAYYVSLERKCDIDKPRNLAKSVTVE